MVRRTDRETTIRPPPLVISRSFAAPRALVFAAWSSADHMKRWFSPETYTTPDAEVDFRVGGTCAICMRSPDGADSWCRGTYLEIAPPERLVLTLDIVDGDVLKVATHITVTFEDDGAGTRMTVRQAFEVHDEAFLPAIDGSPEGWRTTLDKLEREVVGPQATVARSVVHGSFRLERTYDAPPATVFHAFTDPAAKARWFAGGDGYTVLARAMDVRPGGREHAQGRWANGTVSTFDAVYFDVVPGIRLVYAYEMTLDGRKISVSLASIELASAGSGTRLVVSESGAFLDGYDDAGAREKGTGFLLDRLGASLLS
jgi:uncharacterized protein YndB with AHSA1/START domain